MATITKRAALAWLRSATAVDLSESLLWGRSATTADCTRQLAWVMLNTPVNGAPVELVWRWLVSGPPAAKEVVWGSALERDIEKALAWVVWSPGPTRDVEIAWAAVTPLDIDKNLSWAVWSAGPKAIAELVWNAGLNRDLARNIIWQSYAAQNAAWAINWNSATALNLNRQLLWNSYSAANIAREIIWDVNSLIKQTTSLIWWGQFTGIFNMNSITLTRVSDSLDLEIESFKLDLSRDSWCWSFSATTRDAAVCTALDPETAGPIEVELDANGSTWRFIIEGISEGRDFRSGRVWQLQGRSPAAVLAAPYALPLTTAWTSAKNARQIVQEVLSGSGFSETWNITDWTIPAGALAVENATRIEILSLIAKATGAVIQVDPAAATLDFSYLYPVSPADFATLGTVVKWFAEDFEISGGWTWEPVPGYNYVIVSGRDQGVIVHVKRSGSTCTDIAETVIDPLIAVEIVGRERGRSILDREGFNRRLYTLRTPFPIPGSGPDLVVPGDLTGVVDPEIGSWKAPVRSVSLEGSLSGGCWLTTTLEKVLI